MGEALPVALPKTGETVDRHLVIGEIARGGMAAVLAVKRTGAGGFEKLLALKMILPHLAGERHFVEMFLDEARLSSQIDHPNVCRVLDVGTHLGVPYLLMELVHGRSFAAIAERAQAMRIDRVQLELFWLNVLAQAAAGLHAAHEARAADGEPLGIVHRDVSPQNVLVGFDGRVRVVDFGIAAGRGRLVGTRTGEIKGKLAYLAPEQIQRDQAIGRATDLWGLGVVAWELFAGKRLFADAEEAKVLWSVMSARIPDLAREAPGLPHEVVDVVMRCLERDATQRPVDASAVSAAFLDAAAAVARTAGAPTPSVVATMRLLFPDATETWSVATLAPPSADASAPAMPVVAPAMTTGETVTLALPLRAAAPRARATRWLAPTAALLVAALAGAALARSSTSTRTEDGRSAASAPLDAARAEERPVAGLSNADSATRVEEMRVDAPPAPSSIASASPSVTPSVAPSVAPSGPLASSSAATSAPARPVTPPASRLPRPPAPASTSASARTPPPSTGGRLMSNPF